MPSATERLQHFATDNGVVHIAFPTADLTLCQLDREPLAKTVDACACARCLANMHNLVRVDPAVQPKAA